MKRYSLLALIALFMLPLLAARPEKILPKHLAGSMMPYDFNKEVDDPVWPDSLTPVYVARVARHGARYISSAKKLDGIKRELADARMSGGLSGEGIAFSRLIDEVERVTGDQWGRLSDVGSAEEVRLARDLYALMPRLMEKARVHAVSSYVPRVVKTMDEFNHELSALSSQVSVRSEEGREYDWLMRCFTADTVYAAYRKDGDWKEVYDRMADSIVPQSPARRLFTTGYSLSDKKLRHLTLDMYDILQSLTAFGMPAPTEEFMSEAEYQACWQVDNLEHYLRNTITPLSSLAGKASSPLLARIISDADRALDARLVDVMVMDAQMSGSDVSRAGYDAGFYFGHAETLMPLLSLMRVDGCWDLSSDYSTLHRRWKDYDVVPLGANLDIIMLASPSHKIYTAVRHNGRFVMPMADSRLIVGWNEYKAYLIDIMMSLR